MSRIKSLDSLRGLAASIVVFHHSFTVFAGVYRWVRDEWPRFYGVLEDVSNLNVEAVLLFFLISGFSIRVSSNKLDFHIPDDRNFYVYKRFRRLFPLYWVALAMTLLAGVVLGELDDQGYQGAVLVGNLLFLQTPVAIDGGWFPPYGGNGPLWSLSFEMFFYLVYLYFGRFQGYANSKGGLLAVGFTVTGFAFQQLCPNPISLFMSHFIIWYVGVQLAEEYLRSKKDAIKYMSVIVNALFLLVCVVFLLFARSQTIYSWVWGLSLYYIWGVVFMLSSKYESLAKVVDDAFYRVFGFIGSISYALYLFHYPVFKYCSSVYGDGSVSSMLFSVVVIVVLSFVAERVFERCRCEFLKQRYFSRAHG